MSIKFAIPLMIMMALMPQTSFANPDFTKKTAKKCVYCHIGNWTSQQYTEAGQYFREHNTLKGFVPKQETTAANPEGQPKDHAAQSTETKKK